MKSFFTKNVGWKLLSLAAAFLLWMAVASEPELSTFVSVPVGYKNLSPDMELNSDIAESVFLEVRGPSGELRSLPESRRRYAIILDMGNVGAGQHTFPIDGSSVRLPRGIELVRAIPSQIRLDFEPSTTRSVPVAVRFESGLPADLKVVQDAGAGFVHDHRPGEPRGTRDHGRDRPHRPDTGTGHRGVPGERVRQ